jgi:hypothetical protein
VSSKTNFAPLGCLCGEDVNDMRAQDSLIYVFLALFTQGRLAHAASVLAIITHVELY